MATYWPLASVEKLLQFAEGSDDPLGDDILLTGEPVLASTVNWQDTGWYMTVWGTAHYYLEYQDQYEFGIAYIAGPSVSGNSYGEYLLGRGRENSGVQYTNSPYGKVVVPEGQICKVSCAPPPHRRHVSQAIMYWSQWLPGNTETVVNFDVLDFDEESQWLDSVPGFRLHTGKPVSKICAAVTWDDDTAGTFRRIAIQIYDVIADLVVAEWENRVPADIIGYTESTQYVEAELVSHDSYDLLTQRNSDYVIRVVAEHDATYDHGFWEGYLTVEYYG